MALSLLSAASAQLAFGPLNRDSGAGARAGWVLEAPAGYAAAPQRIERKARQGVAAAALVGTAGPRRRDVSASLTSLAYLSNTLLVRRLLLLLGHVGRRRRFGVHLPGARRRHPLPRWAQR